MQDIDRGQKFYETVLAIQMTDLPNPTTDELTMRMFSSDENAMGQTGASGAIAHMPGFPSGSNSTIVYFICEDCAVEESRVEGAGGAVFKSKMSIGPHGFISLCTDPDGNMFGLHSMS